MSIDFGCIETCIFPDFEDYDEPFEDEGMSEEEEDYLDYLLGSEDEEIQMKFGNHQKFICKVQTKMFNKIKKTQKKNNHTTILGK
jgi:succinate dehydrogenase flavin-adding protein (antitoxin of CptAB toxin-antitoxin module)